MQITVWVDLHVHAFPFTFQKQASRCIGYTKVLAGTYVRAPCPSINISVKLPRASINGLYTPDTEIYQTKKCCLCKTLNVSFCVNETKYTRQVLIL